MKVFFVDFGNEETKKVEEDCLDFPPSAIDIVPARTFDREEVEELLCGKNVSVKLSVEGGREFARFFIDKGEVMIGRERSSSPLYEDMSVGKSTCRGEDTCSSWTCRKCQGSVGSTNQGTREVGQGDGHVGRAAGVADGGPCRSWYFVCHGV